LSPGPHQFQFVIHDSGSWWAILRQNQIELVTVIIFTVRGNIIPAPRLFIKKKFMVYPFVVNVQVQ
jgi:hypothetical protein